LTNFWIFFALVCADAFADAMASRSVSIALIAKDKLQALQFAVDFLLEPPWQLLSNSSAQAFQPQHALRVHRLVVVDAVDGAKSLDTVDVLAAFVDEAVTLTVQPPVILFGNAWHTHHAHAPSVTAAVARRRCDPSSLVVHVG
jgi:hypothetical protein